MTYRLIANETFMKWGTWAEVSYYAKHHYMMTAEELQQLFEKREVTVEGVLLELV